MFLGFNNVDIFQKCFHLVRLSQSCYSAIEMYWRVSSDAFPTNPYYVCDRMRLNSRVADPDTYGSVLFWEAGSGSAFKLKEGFGSGSAKQWKAGSVSKPALLGKLDPDSHYKWKSWIGIWIKVNIQVLKRIKMEPWRAVDALNGALKGL